MTTRSTIPLGTPCWADLWTSDTEGSRRFYRGVFGWEALDPDPEFGGYFNFARHGAWTAGAMGSMGDMKANDTWKPYLASDDADATAKRIEAAGGQVRGGPMPVGDLGIQLVATDPTGASFGVWQPRSFSGFAVIGEDGAPSWFELHTADHAAAVSFYREVFELEVTPVADTDEFRYFTFRSAGTEEDTGGIMDSRAWVPEGAAAWSIYWEVADMDATTARVGELGGSILQGPEVTPYGTLTEAADPAGARFKLRTSP
ncbi:MAG: VOC family protein [Actinomycetota bacterium]|nr:VOC family protein [Actinomycetota bacterium]